MAGVLAGVHGASEEESREVTTEIIELAVEEGRYCCRRSYGEFIEDTVHFYTSLRDRAPDGYGVRVDVEFYKGEDEFLAQIEDEDERHFAYMLLVCAKLAERRGEVHFAWPAAKVVAYMNLGCGKEYSDKDYMRFKYLTAKRYNPNSTHFRGGPTLVDKIPPTGRKAAQYEH